MPRAAAAGAGAGAAVASRAAAVAVAAVAVAECGVVVRMQCYEGESMFRMRVLLACLTRRVVKMKGIREQGDYQSAIGLRDYEASLLRLVDKLTDGTKIAINETGTALRLVPGEIVGGEVEHAVPGTGRNFSYFLEFATLLGLFGKRPLHLRLRTQGADGNGETGTLDNSLEIFKSVTVPLLNRLLMLGGGGGAGGGISVRMDKVRKCVELQVEVLGRAIAPVQWTETEGKVKRIRGLAWTHKCSSQFTGRMVDACRAVLNQAVGDVWIFADAQKDGSQLESFGVSLVSETDKQVFKGSSGAAVGGSLEEAEQLGTEIAKQLLAEVNHGGVVDQSHQWIAALVLAISADHKVGRLTIGNSISDYTAECMRLIRDFFGIKFRFGDSPDGLVLECVGCGLTNLARKTF